jgi:hypothetical protein
MKYQRSGDNYIMRNLMICILTHYCSGNQIEKNEMGGTRGTYGGEEKRIHGFGGET